VTIGAVAIASGPIAGPQGAAQTGDTQTSLAVEVSFTTGALETPVWEDITGDVRSWDVSRGRTRELERFQPGRATVVLSNRARQYDSATNSDIRPMRRIRIRETFNGVTYPTFDGYVDNWTLDYPGVGLDATATVTATDGFKILTRTDLPRSVYAIEVEADNPIVWWRLDEIKDAASDDDLVALNAGSLGTSGDASYVGIPVLGSEALVVNDASPSMLNFSPLEAAGTGNMGTSLSAASFDPFDFDPWVFECWVALERDTDPDAQVLMSCGDPSGNGVLLTFNPIVQDFLFQWTSSTTSGSISAGVTVEVHQRYHVVIKFDVGGVAQIWVNGTLGTDNVTIAGAFDAGPTTLAHVLDGGSGGSAGDFNLSGRLSNAAFYVDADAAAFDQDRVDAHYAAGTAPWQDDTPDERAGRVLELADWPDDLRELDTTTLVLQSAELAARPVLEHLQKVAETEFGLLFVSRAGVVRLVSQAAQAARTAGPVVFGDDTGEVGYRAITFADGEEVLRNRALISRLGGVLKTAADSASVTEFGRFDYRLDGLLHRTEARSQDYADFIVAEYAEPRRRITSITVGPPIDGEEVDVYPAMLGPELGEAVVVRNRPLGGGDPFEQTSVVEGISHRGEPGGQRETTFVLSPEFTGDPEF